MGAGRVGQFFFSSSYCGVCTMYAAHAVPHLSYFVHCFDPLAESSSSVGSATLQHCACYYVPALFSVDGDSRIFGVSHMFDAWFMAVAGLTYTCCSLHSPRLCN